MSGWTWFVVLAGLVVVGSLVVGAWMDHEARKRGSKLASASEMSRAIKDARREARASRSRLHVGGHRGPTNPVPPRWDDRPR